MSHLLLLVDVAGDSGGPLSIEGARWPTAGITENIQVGITRYDFVFVIKEWELSKSLSVLLFHFANK
jgi:hypothetical protein